MTDSALANRKQAPPLRHPTNNLAYGIDERQQLNLVALIEEGCSGAEACRIAGVKEPTYKDWLKKGRVEDAIEPYRSFVEEVEKAEAKAVFKAEGAIQKAFDKDWKAAAWYLARKRPQEYGDKPQMQIATGGNVSIYLPDNGRDAVLPLADEDPE